MATNDATPWEPPLAGTEVEHLLGALNRLRVTFRWKTAGLDAKGLNTRIPSSGLTLGGLLKHLACVADVTFTVKLAGAPPGEPWQTVNWDEAPDWDFTSAAADSPEQLYALWDGAVRRAQARVGVWARTRHPDGLPESATGGPGLVNMTCTGECVAITT